MSSRISFPHLCLILLMVSSYFFLVGFFAVLYGTLLLGEPITPGLVIGMVLITSGIYFINAVRKGAA